MAESLTHGLFIIISGLAAAKKKRRLRGCIERLQSNAASCEIVLTNSTGHARELAEFGYKQGYRCFASGGGDGTNFEVLNGLYSQGIREDVSLGFIPIGTGNSFVRDFGTPDECVESITINRRRKIDVFELIHADGSLYFLNQMSLGFVAKVAAFRNRFLRPLGSVGYVVAVLANLLRSQEYSLSYLSNNATSSEAFRASPLFVSFNNSRCTGGKMLIAPQADPADGLIDIIRAEPMSSLNLLRSFPKIFDGSHVNSPFVTTRRANSVLFEECVRQLVVIDGEVLEIKPQQLVVHHQCLTIYA